MSTKLHILLDKFAAAAIDAHASGHDNGTGRKLADAEDAILTHVAGESIASRAITAWCEHHRKPIPWAKAVEIMAQTMKMAPEEKARLLNLEELTK